MSKNTTIREGGKGYPFGPVKCLMVEGGNGEFYPWYPEADRALDSLSVDKNGIYRASDDGAYGWSSVSVNVSSPDHVTGKDDDGDITVVYPDPVTGELMEEKVPSSIEIITPPTKLIYVVGDTLDFAGITVKAYFEESGEYGDVPFDELIFPVTVAPMSPYGRGEASYEGETIAYGISGGLEVTDLGGGYTRECEIRISGDVRLVGLDGTPCIIFTDQNASVYARREIFLYGRTFSKDEVTYTWSNTNAGTTDNGVAYRWEKPHGSGGGIFEYSEALFPNNQEKYPEVAANILFGGTNVIVDGYAVPVQWHRPGDYAILETSFDIAVKSASGGGGQAGDTGAGRND